MKKILIALVPFALLFFSCSEKVHLSNSQVSQVRIKGDSLKIADTAMLRFIAPYRQKLDSQMNIVIGYTVNDLLKARPEGTLCNLVADAALEYASQHYGSPVNACVMNYGGVRIPGISKGPVTLGKMFELMPFDNEIVVLSISGKTLMQLLDLTAANDGWPVSGIIMEIRDRKTNIAFVGTEIIDPSKTYTLVTSDYLANGGDQAFMLKDALSFTSLNYKLRDAITDYVTSHNPLNVQVEGRVTKAE